MIPGPLTPEQRQALCALVFEAWNDGYQFAQNEPAAWIRSPDFQIAPERFRAAVRRIARTSRGTQPVAFDADAHVARLRTLAERAGPDSPYDDRSDADVYDDTGALCLQIDAQSLPRVRHMLRPADADMGWNAFHLREGKTVDDVWSVIEADRGLG